MGLGRSPGSRFQGVVRRARPSGTRLGHGLPGSPWRVRPPTVFMRQPFRCPAADALLAPETPSGMAILAREVHQRPSGRREISFRAWRRSRLAYPLHHD